FCREKFERKAGHFRALLFARFACNAVGLAGGGVAEIVVVLDGDSLIHQGGIDACDPLFFGPAGFHRGVQSLVVLELRAVGPFDGIPALAVRLAGLFQQHTGTAEIIQKAHLSSLLSSGGCQAVPGGIAWDANAAPWTFRQRLSRAEKTSCQPSGRPSDAAARV